MVQSVWNQYSLQYPNVESDVFIVMPNHIHGIVVLVGAGPRACPSDTNSQMYDVEGQPHGIAPTLSLPAVVHRFKTLITKRYIDGVKSFGWMSFDGRLWQRNYYEHVIRDDESLNRIRQYIQNNPDNWHRDRKIRWQLIRNRKTLGARKSRRMPCHKHQLAITGGEHGQLMGKY